MPATEPSPAPKRFDAYIGGFGGTSYHVELQGDILRHTTNEAEHYKKPRHATITPSEEQWREFRETLDDLQVWRWRAEYPNPGVCDGTGWSLDIAYDDRALESHGDNNYPDASGNSNDHPDHTEVFKQYLAAVEKLLGGGKFR